MRSSFRALLTLAAATLLFPPGARADDWPQWLGPQRDAVWRETGIIDQLPAGGPPVLWRAEIGAGFSSPAVVKGKLFVTDRVIPKDVTRPKDPFATSQIPGVERVLCLNEADGKELWKHEYDCPYTVSYASGPRTTPLVHDGRVYTLGTMGDLLCLDTLTGKVIWSKDCKKDYDLKIPLWGIASSPLLDGDKLICLAGGENGRVLALDRRTGKEIWRSVPAKEIGYCPPVIYTINGRRQLIIWHPGAVNGLDPETGRILWSEPWAIRSELSVTMPRLAGNDLFLTAFYNGAALLRFEAGKTNPAVVWRTQKQSERDTTHLNSIISTPFIEDGYVYGACSYGQFRCLKLETGERVWETFVPTGGKEARWATAFIMKHDRRYFLFSEKGDLIIANLTPKGYAETSRAHIIDPLNPDPGRLVVWTQPVFANRHLYIRNDREMLCVDLAARKP